MATERKDASPEHLMTRLANDSSYKFYPDLIDSTVAYKDNFNKQFGDIIGKKLKKKLEKTQNVEEKQI